MDMFFMLGDKVTILFKQWKTHNTGELIASCFALFVLSILYEGFKVFRQVLTDREQKRANEYFTNSTEGISGLTNNVIILPPRRRLCSSPHIIQSLMHTCQVAIGYLLMLAAMTYNVWICLSIVIGSGVGYYLFGWKTSSLASSGDHCN